MGLSFWLNENVEANPSQATPVSPFNEGDKEPLEKSEKVDVCIIGGGLTGILCAYMLCEQDLKISVLEKNKIGSRDYGKHHSKINIGTFINV